MSSRSRRPALSRRLRPLDQLDPVPVGVLHEAKAGPAFAHGVRLALRLDALLLQPRQRLVEVVDTDGNVAVARAEVVAASVVIEGQFQLRLVVRHPEEIVRCLELTVSYDR